MDRLKTPGELNFEGGNVAQNYRVWLQRFELYSLASGLSQRDEKVQCTTFLHVAGTEAIKVFNTFDFQDVERDKMEVLKEKFSRYCEPRKNVIYTRHMFFLRNQEVEEAIDSYVTDLKTKAKDCEFGELCDSLIRDRMVCGVRDPQLKAILLRNDALTLRRCVEICQGHEQSVKSMKQLTEEQSVSTNFVQRSTGVQPKQVCKQCGHTVHKTKECPATSV
ncbi:Uncharacterised protein r2_g2480 [Pycnogonum litorale]